MIKLILYRNCISTLAHERNVKCLASFYDQLIDIGANKLKVPCQFFISVLFDTFSVFSMHGNSEFPENLKAKLDRIITMCHQQFEDLCRVFCKTDFTNSTIKELATGWELNMTLKSLVFHADFLHVYPNLDKSMSSPRPLSSEFSANQFFSLGSTSKHRCNFTQSQSNRELGGF